MVEVTCSGLLFDLDGVLVDSTPAVARVWAKWAIAHGFDPEETVRQAHGRPSIETVREILPGADFEKENEVILRDEIEDTEGVVPLPGARELLSSLPENQWALVTSCARPLAEVRLKDGEPPSGREHPPDLVQRPLDLLDRQVLQQIAREDHVQRAVLERAGADWILPGYQNLSVSRSDHGSNSLRLLLKL